MIFARQSSKPLEAPIELNINDLYSNEINQFLNIAAAEQDCSRSKYINELFIYFYRPYYAIKNRIDHCGQYTVDDNLAIKYRLMLDAINKEMGFKSLNEKPTTCLWFSIGCLVSSIFKLIVAITGLVTFAMINAIVSKKTVIKDSVILERTPAAHAKLKWHRDNSNSAVLYDKIEFNNEFYSAIRFTHAFCLLPVLILNTYRDLKFIIMYSNKYFGIRMIPYIVDYYSKRVPHCVFYEFTLAILLSSSKVKKVFSGNNLDRFALIEEDLARKYSVTLINIPHGIEYGFKLPHCFTGDIFYSYSQEGANYFNNLYQTNKFLFSESVTYNMLARNFEKTEKFYVLFTEPFEIGINRAIAEAVKRLSVKTNIRFYIKIHPKDKKSNYEDLDVDFIDDFDSAITNNICIARKSTVLLEAIYNNSKAIAVLLNESDRFGFDQFPSLQDKRIVRIYKLDQLELGIWGEMHCENCRSDSSSI